MFKSMEKASLITGVALGLTASVLPPIVKDTMKNLAIIGVRGVMELTDSTKSTLKLAREEIEDIIAEAQFVRMTNQVNEAIGLSHSKQQSSEGSEME